MQKFFFQDIAILNFFFDTPIITEITVELRTNVFDMISAIGGTLGLFTGISVITIGNKENISNMPLKILTSSLNLFELE